MNRPMQVRRSSAPFVPLHEAPTAAAVSVTLQHTTTVFLLLPDTGPITVEAVEVVDQFTWGRVSGPPSILIGADDAKRAAAARRRPCDALSPRCLSGTVAAGVTSSSAPWVES